MNSSEYDKEVHKLLYHLGEVSKSHSRLIDSNKDKAEVNDKRLHDLEKEVALMEKEFVIMTERMKGGLMVNEPHIDKMVVNRQRSTSDFVKDTGTATVVIGTVIAIAKIVYEFIIKELITK